MRLFANRAYLPAGWADDVAISIKGGTISSVETNTQQQPGDQTVDTLLPAISNLHSHTFQRAMAGMTEYRAEGRESFWTWRELMYRHLDRLTPEQIEAIAALAFMEMLEAGYGAVGEFHYVHHAPNGQVYDDLGELSARIMAAADATGIGLTHLPVLYTFGGVDGRALEGGQLRFGNGLDRYCDLVSRCQTMARDMPNDTEVGIAPHSLRAISPTDLTTLLKRTPEGPVHIHIAEQTAEVDEVLAAYGARPVEWLLGHADVDARWCLIHATHMTDAEIRAMAQSGAVAGLCPVTEANLGDGVFAASDFLTAGGAFGVGTDSNINISVSEELRMLEYSQRLAHRQRNVVAPEDGSTGTTLFAKAATGGARALNRNAGAIATGKLADLTAINGADPALCLLSAEQMLDGLIFAGSDRVVTDVWSAGRHCVQNGRHINREKIVAQYVSAVVDLKSK